MVYSQNIELFDGTRSTIIDEFWVAVLTHLANVMKMTTLSHDNAVSSAVTAGDTGVRHFHHILPIRVRTATQNTSVIFDQRYNFNE